MSTKKFITLFSCLALSYAQISFSMETVKTIAGQLFSKESAQFAGAYAASSLALYAIMDFSSETTYSCHKWKDTFKQQLNNIAPALFGTLGATCAGRLGLWQQLSLSDLKTPALSIIALSSIVGLYKGVTTYRNPDERTYSTVMQQSLRASIRGANTCITFSCNVGLPLYLLARRYTLS